MAALTGDNVAHTTIRLLFVDDKPAVTDLASTAIGRRADIDVTTVNDPVEGLRLARTGRYDCLVSDYQMPGMDGLTLCELVRAQTELPCIVFTSAVEEVATLVHPEGVSLVHKNGGIEQYDRLVDEMRSQLQ